MVIALALIEQGGKYHLQLRGENPVIGGAGRIGCFGGKIEDETPAQAVVRELGEETFLVIAEEDVVELGKVEVISDHKLETVRVFANVFHVVIEEDWPVKAREGKLVTITKSEVPALLDKMTTGTRAVFEQIVLKEN